MVSLHDFVLARIYEKEEDVLKDALRCLLRFRPDLKIQLALNKYQNNDISLGKAASMGGVSWAQMKEILQARGIELRLGPENIESARQEVESLRNFFLDQGK